MPETALPTVFSGAHTPIAAGVIRPWGQATPVPGGYRVSGRWPFASGIRNATWFCGGTAAGATVSAWESGSQYGPISGRQARSPRLRRRRGDSLTSPLPGGETRMIFVPVSQVMVHDNWQVLGLQGTGSCDVSIDNLFVPQDMTWVAWENPQRGGPLYRLGRPAFLAAEHAAFALGAGRLALDAILALAQRKQRGLTPAAPTIARRPAFQRDLAEADLKLRGARALLEEIYENVWATACAGDPLTPQQQVETRSIACYVTQVAAEAATLAYRYGGGEANYLSSRLQRCLRDVYGAAQHQLVSNDAYEEHAQGLLGLAGTP